MCGLSATLWRTTKSRDSVITTETRSRLVSLPPPPPRRLRLFNDVLVAPQVLSGGVVLQLTAGHRVWLQPFRDEQTDGDKNDIRDKRIIFNGFLLFSD